MIIDYQLWRDVGTALKNHYAPRYFNPELCFGQNLMECLTVLPGIEKFFAPAPLTVYIICQPIGWQYNGGTLEDHWPPSGLTDGVERHKAAYERWTNYKTKIYMDFNIVNIVDARDPGTRFREMMVATEGHIEDLCEELEDYGFEYLGRIEEGKDESFFYPLFDPWFNIEES